VRQVVVALSAAVVLLAGCSDDGGSPVPGPNPGPAQVDVDTPDLRALREEAGVDPCRPGPGDGALPSLTLPCLGGGESVDLATLRGPMVLSFWAAWCDPCRVEMPALQEFYKTYGDRVPVLGIDWNDRYPGTALEQVRDRGVTYPSLADPGGETQGLTELTRVGRGLPYIVLLDEKGEVAYEENGGLDSPDEVADLVREHLGVSL
jgi:thiol-disulfide isomerase/thioredoxin